MKTRNYLAIAALASIFLAFSDTVCGQARTTAQKGLDDKVAKNCVEYKKEVDAIKIWIAAHKNTKPAIPVPPVVDPECHDCNEVNPTDQKQAIIDAFNNKSKQPEADMITTLLKIEREKSLLTSDNNTSPQNTQGSASSNSGMACLYDLSDDEIQRYISFLMNREVDKANGMLDTYYNRGEFFPGGIQFYLMVMRDRAMLGFGDDNLEDTKIPAWIKEYFNKYKNRLFNEYQYQLFPAIFYLPRQMELLGADLTYNKVVNHNGQYDLEKIDEVTEAWNKAISFMHFKLTIDYVGDGSDQDGDMAKVRFNGETELKCQINRGHQNPCFEWGPETSGLMTFKIKQVEFHGHDKEVVTYDGPSEFSVPVHFNVNMCDDQPEFRMFFDRLWPQEEHYKHNQVGELTTPLLYRVVSATLGNANEKSLEKEVDKMKASTGKYSETEMEAWNQRMEAHANDPNYFKTAQGKKGTRYGAAIKKAIWQCFRRRPAEHAAVNGY